MLCVSYGHFVCVPGISITVWSWW